MYYKIIRWVLQQNHIYISYLFHCKYFFAFKFEFVPNQISSLDDDDALSYYTIIMKNENIEEIIAKRKFHYFLLVLDVFSY